MDVNKSSTLIVFATTAWGALAFGGCVLLAVYGQTVGPSGENPSRHPDVASSSTTGQYQLEMFIHPKCPCTRASLVQLAQVMSRVSWTASKQPSGFSILTMSRRVGVTRASGKLRRAFPE